MNAFSFKQIVARLMIIGFWGSVILLFLFSPRLLKFFRKERSLTVFTFPMVLDADFLAKFEKETGVKLHISYYENNDELLVKLRETKGRGYDIVIPSDYAVELLIKEGLLKKLDKSKLTFLSAIDPIFLNLYFDPNNEYSFPYLWEIYNIGFNKNAFKAGVPEASWDLVFDQKRVKGRIGMMNNAREAILLAAYALFGTIDNLTSEQLQQVKTLLIKQKKWVEAYTDLRSDYLLVSGTCPIAVGMSGEIWHAARFDENIDFLIPKEGTFLVVDSIALAAKSRKQDMAYAFINYLFKSEVVSHHANRYSLFPATKNVKLPDFFVKSMAKIKKSEKKMNFFRNVLSEKQLNDIWIELKAN